jgi:hypothetical protein
MNRVAIAGGIVLALLTLVSDAATASGTGAQDKPDNAEARGSKPSPDQRQLNAAIRGAIFRNREELLKYLGDRRSRSAICTPAPNDSYHLFQESLQEGLDVLWDLDIYATKYRLSKEQHRAVRACAAQMERYSDNFQLWKQLNRVQDNALAK